MPTLETRRLNPFILWGTVLAVAVLIVVGVRSFTREKVEIRVAAVNHQNLPSTVSTNGRVEPVEIFQAHSPAPGVVEKLYVEVGQKVKAGDLLVKMEDADTVSPSGYGEVDASRRQSSTCRICNRVGRRKSGWRCRQTLTGRRCARSRLSPIWLRCVSCSRKGAASAAEVVSAEQRLQEATSSLAEHAVARHTALQSRATCPSAGPACGCAGSCCRCTQQLCSRRISVLR